MRAAGRKSAGIHRELLSICRARGFGGESPQGDSDMALTRRALLEQIGKAGGLGAAYMAMEALGLAIPTPAGAESFALPKASGSGRSVVVLGAGIAGLVSAYELQRA